MLSNLQSSQWPAISIHPHVSAGMRKGCLTITNPILISQIVLNVL